MTSFDLNTWAVVAYNDDTGLGRMARQFVKVLGLGRHLVAPSERLADRVAEPGVQVSIPAELGDAEMRAALKGLQGIISLERSSWHPRLASTAESLGIPMVVCPMWEWTIPDDPDWANYRLMACCTEMTLRMLAPRVKVPCVHLPLPLDLSDLPQRSIRGRARLFVHNAGIVDPDDRKGTRDTVRAFSRVRQADVCLLVRMQKEAPMPKTDSRVEFRIGNLDDHGGLYGVGDVAIQPSKMEGIGFMVLEPFCSGIPVITTDYAPMNEYVRDPHMLVRPRWGRRRAFPTSWVKHAHLRVPQTSGITERIEWCAKHDMAEISAANRRDAEERYNPERVRQKWSSALAQVLQSQ